MTATLAERLKQLRIRSGQSLQGVADAVKASKAHVWELETGKSRNPSVDLLTKLAEHFRVPVAYLVGEDPGAQNDPQLIALFRDLKDLSPPDREVLRATMEALKRARDVKE